MVRSGGEEEERVRLLDSPETERSPIFKLNRKGDSVQRDIEQRQSRGGGSTRTASQDRRDCSRDRRFTYKENEYTPRESERFLKKSSERRRMSEETEPSLKVVSEILDDMESMDATESQLSQDTQDPVVDDDNDVEQGVGDVTTDEVDGADPEPCQGCRLPGSTDLVVDVHLQSNEDIPRPCIKHSFDRFPRCYSESRGNLSREEFRNLDKIETIGEDRLRHLSEGAKRGRGVWGSRGSRGVFSSEKSTLHRSSHPESKYEISEYEPSLPGSNLGSTQQLEDEGSKSEVRFQIFEDPGAASDSAQSSLQPDSFQECVGYPAPALDEGNLCYKTTMSTSSSTTSMPICRICQLPSMEPSNHLISPCRCLGSIRYVHNPCLLKWLEVSARKNTDAPCCELCQFQYLRKKRFVVSHCLFPSCSTRDRVLHAVFLLAIALMVTCAGVTILCFKQDRDNKPKTVGPNTELSPSELMTLSCGVLFFLAFFVAMYVEVKAKNTVYQLICKFLYMNYEWTIQEYDRRADPAKQIEDS